MAKKDYLGKEELLEVIQKYNLSKSEAERDALKEIIVQNNLRMVIKIAQSYASKYSQSADDLFQNGVIGILVALERFKPSKNVSFFTYAVYWIDNFIRRAIDDTKLINTHRYLKSGSPKIKLYFKCFEESEGDADKFIALMRKHKISQKQQHNIEQVIAMDSGYVDIYKQVDPSLGDGGSRVVDIIPDKHATSPADEAIDGIIKEKIMKCVNTQLTPIERQVIKGLYFSNKKVNMHRICLKINKSKQTMVKIKIRALAKISRSLAKDKKFVVVSMDKLWPKSNEEIS